MSTARRQSYDDFVTLAACFLSVAALGPDHLLDEDVALADVVADFDEVLDDAAQTVAE